MDCSYNSRMTRCGVSLTSATVWSAAERIALAIPSYCCRSREVHSVASVDDVRRSHPLAASSASPSLIDVQAVQVGSSVIISMGPSSCALAMSARSNDVLGGVSGSASVEFEPSRTNMRVVTTESATTTRTARPPRIHMPARLRSLPRLSGLCGVPSGMPLAEFDGSSGGCHGPGCGLNCTASLRALPFRPLNRESCEQPDYGSLAYENVEVPVSLIWHSLWWKL